MAARAAFTRCHLHSLCGGGFRSGRRFSVAREAELEGGKVGTGHRIHGALPHSLEKHDPNKYYLFGRKMPPGLDAVDPFIVPYELYDVSIPVEPLNAKSLNLFLPRLDTNSLHYFTAHSVEDDGTITPKYYMYPPSPINNNDCFFTGATCNAVPMDGGVKEEVIPLELIASRLESLPADSEMDAGKEDVPSHSLDSNSFDITKGLSSRPARERVFKYTLQRKWKREALVVSEVNGSCETEKKIKDEQNGELKQEQSKLSLLKESSQDCRRLAQVARQGWDKNDIFENDHLAQYYGDIGPKRMQFSMRWPFLVPEAKFEHLEQKMYFHGMWPIPVLTPEEMKRDHNELTDSTRYSKMIELYDTQVSKYWPDLKDPTSADSANRWIFRVWKKHGKPAGMNASMYLYYGLAIRSVIPDDFGIPVGVSMTLREASECVKKVLMELKLFGKDIGSPVYPEIFTSSCQFEKSFVIHEVRPHFTRVLVDNKAQLKPIDVNGKCYTGAANHESSLVILPTREQIRDLIFVK